MTRYSTTALIRKTMPFLIARLVVYAVFFAATIVLIGILAGIGFLVAKMFKESGGALIVIMLVGFGVIYGGLKFVERYILGLVKVGHVAVLAELLSNGEIPDGKGQIAYGKEKVTKEFGTANIAFAIDALVGGAVRQIQRWLTRAGEMLSFIPGSQRVVAIANAILAVGLNYIDEAVLGYVFVQGKKAPEKSPWTAARDGVILYAQSWRGMLKTSVFAVVCIWGFNLVVFLPLILTGMVISRSFFSNVPNAGWLGGIGAAIVAYIITTLLKRALVDPLLTCAMVRQFFVSTEELEPNAEMQQKLTGVSSKFKKLVEKAKSAPTPVPAKAITTESPA